MNAAKYQYIEITTLLICLLAYIRIHTVIKTTIGSLLSFAFSYMIDILNPTAFGKKLYITTGAKS